ncbi:MAG TPA: histidine phosphatase family protein [Gaiellaceae bacterium]|nr:histidine phosphatase family protein [Gaiellaceae bacterium]
MLIVVSRHAHSVLNQEGRVNGDPTVAAPLSEEGREQARLLGEQIVHLELDLCVHTRFPRTRETAEIALAGRSVPFEVEPLLDDVDVGDLDGAPLEDYRKVKRSIGRKTPFPGGESLDQAALRYARGFRAVARRNAARVLVVCHEIPLRYALNAAAGSDLLDGPPFHDLPNAVPYLFDAGALEAAVARIETLAG